VSDRIFTLDTELWLPKPREAVFTFFADAFGLERITPPSLRFEVLTPSPITMRAGLRVDYRLRLYGWPIRWQSEITTWEPPFRFVDEQRRGPYRTWIHEHVFVQRDGGTLVLDRVRYAVPFGALADRLFVRRALHRIFDFRRTTITAILS